MPVTLAVTDPETTPFCVGSSDQALESVLDRACLRSRLVAPRATKPPGTRKLPLQAAVNVTGSVTAARDMNRGRRVVARKGCRE